MIRTAICAAALSAGLHAAQLHAQTTDPAILSTVHALDSAWARRDTVTIRRLIAPDYIYFSSLGGTRDADWLVRLVASPEYHLDYVQRSDLVAYQWAQTAVVSTRWVGRGRYGKETIDDDQRCSLVLTRSTGAWRVVSEHCTQIVPRPS